MVEIVYTAPDVPTLIKAATNAGFYDAVNHQIVTNAPLAGGGSWFFNNVGPVSAPVSPPQTVLDSFGNPQPVTSVVAAQAGRLRINGDAAQLPAIIAICQAAGVTVYQLVTPTDGSTPFWSADGSTPAPDWVANVGIIA